MLYMLRKGQDKALPLEYSTQEFTEGELRTLVACLPELLGEELFLLDYEPRTASSAGSRAGILALDRKGRPYIVAVRQGGADAEELQVLEQAATYSKATVADLADIYAVSRLHGEGKLSPDDALSQIRQYLEEGDSGNGHIHDPAIVVFASDFRPEFTTTAAWLKNRGVDISCVRFRGYHVDNSWVLDVEHDSPFALRQEPRGEVSSVALAPVQVAEPSRDQQLTAEPAAELAQPASPDTPELAAEDDATIRYPLLAKVRGLLAHWRPECQIEAEPDTLVFPTARENVYFSMSAHTYPDPAIEIGLRLEQDDLEANRALASQVLRRQEAIEARLGECLNVQDPWYRCWVRLSLQRSYDPYSTAQAAEAADTMAEFIDAILPKLNEALLQFPAAAPAARVEVA